MVSQFGSLGYTIMGKTADLTVVQKTIIDTLHKKGKPQTYIAKEAGCSQSAVLTESSVEGKSVEEKDALQPYEDCQAKLIQDFGWTSQEIREEELDCCSVVQSHLSRWEKDLYFIWKPRS